MKTKLILILTFFIAASGGCTDKAKETEKARQDAAAKARANAAKKEMETLPTVFQNRDIYKKNEPPKSADTKSSGTASTKNP